MINFLIIHSNLFCITLFDGDITFYIAKDCINLTHQFLNFDITSFLYSKLSSASPYTDGACLPSVEPLKPLKPISLNYLIPIFNSYQDIVDNIGRRPNLIIITNVDHIINQAPLFLPPLVVFFNFIIRLLCNYLSCAKSHIFKLLFLLEKNLQLKEYTRYLTDNFFKHINLNFIPRHLTNFNVFSARHTVVTEHQKQDPEITNLLNERARQSRAVHTASLEVRRLSYRLLDLIDRNNITVHESPEGSLSISVPDNFTSDQEVNTSRDLVHWDHLMTLHLDRTIQAYNATENVEEELRGRGVRIIPHDLTSALNNAREAYNRYKSRVVKDQ